MTLGRVWLCTVQSTDSVLQAPLRHAELSLACIGGVYGLCLAHCCGLRHLPFLKFPVVSRAA